MNSFVPINRVPSDVLSLIPTHLSSQDRFRASFVCRHWRRTFLQHAALWSHLYLSKGEVYAKTLLERAKGSPLAILASSMDPIGTVALLPPHTKQIADLEFVNSRWADIQGFSETVSGPLPLLRTLNVSVIQGINPDGLDTVTPSSHSLFSGAVGLKEFCLHSARSPFLRHFVFPNLTSFELSVTIPGGGPFRGSQLLDFLEASPILQTVRMEIISPISLEDIPQEKVVVLHNVESLCLAVRGEGPGYPLATHISCPSVKHTSFTHTREEGQYRDPDLEKFLAPAELKAIVHQYTRDPIEGVALETEARSDCFIRCSLTFRSADMTTIMLRYEVPESDNLGTYEWRRTFSAMYCEVLSRAYRTILDLPLLTDVKRLRMCGPPVPDLDLGGWMMYIARDLKGLMSLGPLEELTICHCDMQPYLFRYLFESRAEEPAAYPPIRVLTISNPLDMYREDFAGGFVELVKAQHELGVPFERVTVRMNYPPAGMEERLRPWVGTVDCYDVPCEDVYGPM